MKYTILPLAALAMVGCGSSDGKQVGVASQQAAQAAISIETIWNAYLDDELKADKAYLGKNLAISGCLGGNQKSKSGKYFVELGDLRTSGRRAGICYLAGSELDKFAKLSVPPLGAPPAIMSGKCVGRKKYGHDDVDFNVAFEECVLVKAP